MGSSRKGAKTSRGLGLQRNSRQTYDRAPLGMEGKAAMSSSDTLLRSGLPDPADRFQRDELVNGQGLTYRHFRRSLTPQYGLVWTQLLAGHAVLIGLGFGLT